jgi:nucleotide-binding universal stress UspA family protein
MQPFRRILVPVEGVRDSLGPIDHAIRLARHFDAEVLLVHVDDALPGRPIDEAERRSAARRDLDALRADLERQRIACETVELRIHPPKEVAETITDAALDRSADLIVMGTHGRSGVSRLFGGSVAEEVVRHAPCATLVVRIPRPLDSESAAAS